ncbi:MULTISPECIES: FKBP-type peptidyl-prolyl cis-trans isomerase [Oceanibaculum]|uniref:Peptidyl-prolyl cis-trans isomerase n=2 Tax=Oceanibaculum indicum TaxID=526216 RepID=K2K5W6_9PROT|nr:MULTISPECIES: peptidylprolyl isomerase [Oceanibaculum]EKE78264.1 FKBP-type peptidyl-prolyl cis-trans isomerase [Oceanibaculum indicum P24]MCH2394595.1 peptidylprolyl isomerase [Oceanibaculum sp.]RKQ73713.1 FKBP-type peptidyl-prolyl cis-trans isomerase 2 [Oceanibaculum indicum]
MSAAKAGDTVRVHYTGTIADGSTFDSSVGNEPIQFVIGEGRVIPGFEQAAVGLTPGESRTVTIPAGEAYGEHRADLVQEVERASLPAEIEYAEGLQLQAQGPNQQPLMLTVTSVTDETITLDANHPLAGKDLTFDIELVEIV